MPGPAVAGHGDLVTVGSAEPPPWGAPCTRHGTAGAGADRVRVVATASLAWPAACREWRGGNYTMGDRVLQNLNRTGLPTANGTEFPIRPSAIPGAALLWLGVSQTGKPNGVAGPPGPLGSGYLTASRACAQS